MTKIKSLVDGIGNQSMTEKYYDDWATDYDQTLINWNYKAPLKAVNILRKIKDKINSNLDLACGTGMFANELAKKYPHIIIDGCDISTKSIKIAKLKSTIKIYLIFLHIKIPIRNIKFSKIAWPSQTEKCGLGEILLANKLNVNEY